MTVSSKTPYQDLVDALNTRVGDARQGLQDSRAALQAAYSRVATGDNQLSIADSYIVQAEFDTPNVDSSWAGRAAVGPYNFAENEIASAVVDTPQASESAGQAAQGLNDAATKLASLAQELSAKGDAWKPAAALAASAGKSADGGSTDANSAGSQADAAGWRLSDSQTQLRFGESNVTQIEFDRPGADVSMYARMADNYLRTARIDLQESANGMDASFRAAGSGDTQAAAAQQTLQQLLAELKKLEGGSK